MTKVIKRDCTEVDFQKEKISNAILKAMKNGSGIVKPKIAEDIANEIYEECKDKVWENNTEVFKNQAYLFGKQSYRISRCKDKVDVIVTDSPLPLSIFYNNDPSLTENFNKSVMDVFNYYSNINYLLLRTKPYNPIGRHQSEKESDALKQPMIDLLNKYNIDYIEANGDIEGYDWIVNDVLNRLENNY